MNRQRIERFVCDYLAGGLTCKEFVEVVTDYLEGALSFTDRMRFHLHLGVCRGCRAYLRQIKQTIQTLDRLPVQPPPPEVREALIERFRNWKRS
jgi:predicted anti-sigma-YlaC factor YlaD